jgi:hypothetical protein
MSKAHAEELLRNSYDMRGHMLAHASILSAAPSYACFSFLRFRFSQKRRSGKKKA